MLSYNINSLRHNSPSSKLLPLLHYAQLHNVAIIFLQECWIPADTPFPTLPPSWTHLYFCCNIQTIGRGLAILIRSDLSSILGPLSLHHSSSSPHYDLLLARLGQYYLINIYIPNSSPLPLYEPLFITLSSLLPNLSSFIIAGDWNHPHAHTSLHALVRRYLDATPLVPLSSNHFTYTSPTSTSLLDNIFSDLAISLYIIEEIPNAPSPHNSIIANLDFLPVSPYTLSLDPTPPPPPERRIRYNRLLLQPHRRDDPEIIDHLKQRDELIAEEINNINTDNLDSLLFHSLIPIAEKYLGSSVIRSKPKPFMFSAEIQEAKQHHKRARQRYLRFRSPTHKDHPTYKDDILLANFHAAQTHWRQLRKSAEYKTKSDLLRQVVNDPSIIFKYNKPRHTSKRSDSRFPPNLNSQEAANFFRILASRLTSIEQYPTHIPFTDKIEFLITPEMVIEAIDCMKPSAPGPDGFDFRFVRRFKDCLSPHLARCFNRAIREGIPDALRDALTILIPKETPPPPDPSKYRPITLLCILVRLLHKVLDIELRKHIKHPHSPLNSNNTWYIFLEWCQAGFLPARNCHEQAFIVHLLQCIHSAFSGSSDSKSFLFGSFLDIKQCFPSIDHGHLLQVLQHHLHLPLEWLEIIRRIITNNRFSVMGISIDLLTGLYQGSSLSPLFAICFLNELIHEIAQYIDTNPSIKSAWPSPPEWNPATLQIAKHLLLLFLFADDMATLGIGQQHTQEVFDICTAWAKKRGITFSPKSVLTYLSGPSTPNDLLPHFTIGNIDLKWTAQNLPSIYIGHPLPSSSTLDLSTPYIFPLDIPHIEKRLYSIRSIFKINKRSSLTSASAWCMAINQIIFASLLFPCAVFDTDYDKLDSMILDHTRHLFNLPYYHPSVSLHRELNIIPSSILATRRALIFAFFIWNISWFGHSALQPLHSDNTNHPVFEIGPLLRLTNFLRAFSPSSSSSPWTSLSTDIDSFTAALNTHIVGLFESFICSSLRKLKRQLRQQHYNTFYSLLSPACSLDSYTPGSPLPLLSLSKEHVEIVLRYKSLSLSHIHSRKLPLTDCIWCKRKGVETGAHLLFCSKVPRQFRDTKQSVLQAIFDDHHTSTQEPLPVVIDPTSRHNRIRLLRLHWGSYKMVDHKRAWTGSLSVLHAAVIFLQQLLNKYIADSRKIDRKFILRKTLCP